jgi:S-adenosyl-L-methionine hydrolase (adenosine-forming)
VTIITLLTDFGTADTYVGQMKGALLSIAPAATLVDLTHAVPPQDVHAGAFLLWTAVEAFLANAVHLAVVDPGVGSARRALALQTQRGDYLVGPDNGLLMPAAARLGGIEGAVALPTPAHASTTFHGRDIFAPAAARLASGTSITQLGEPIEDLVQLTIPTPHANTGEVVHVDTYGNLVTNIPRESVSPEDTLSINGHAIPVKPYYAAAEPNMLLALIGSAGLLEISVRDGSAAERLLAQRGTRVKLSRRRPRE